jgi:two-component system, cell cycle sensor histidine kinase and response regulator CckA
MNPHTMRQDPAFTAMTLDILHNVLSRADNPGRLVDYLTEEIRELTGARCVLFLQCLGTAHRVLGINPSRHLAWAESSERESLYHITHELSEVAMWDPERPCDASQMLQQDGFGLSVAVPLHVGRVRVGGMLVLGLPDQQHIASEIKLLTTLATIVALVLRNAFLFENQERIIADRTRELTIAGFTMDNMMDAVYWINADASFWKVNGSACRMLGYADHELLALKVMDIDAMFPPEMWPEHWQDLKQAGSMNFQSMHRKKDGRSLPVDISVNYFELDGKEYHCAIVRDITERKKAEEERINLQAQYDQAQKMESVGRLAGGVAHDFNNMLGVILGRTEMLLEDIDPALPFFVDIQEIRKAAERSASLTRQLLAFARKQTIAPRVLDLNETVEGMLKLLRRLIGEDIDLVWLPGRGLWPVNMDPSQIDQILANLCVNAGDAIDGVGKVTIHTECVVYDEAPGEGHGELVPGEYVLLAVSDDGCGMNKETLGKLFEPFFTTKEVGKGTGLGLATIYGIVKQNNGYVNVYSEPGQGTTFRLYIPRYLGKSEKEEKHLLEKESAGGHQTILLVEDELTILAMTETMLARMGYRVMAAATPEQAIALAGKMAGGIDLLLTDVIMPGMNGRDLDKHLRSLHPQLKTLFMSGHTADVIAHRGILDEGVAFIEKPFSINDLAAMLQRLLGEE